MSHRSTAARLILGAGLAAAMLLGSAAPGLSRDRYGANPAVAVAPDLEREWLLQLSPGSGVYPGYTRPDLGERASNPKTRTYPGYAAATPGAMPGYAAPPAGPAVRAAATRTYGYPTTGAARAAEPAPVSTGLFGLSRKPAPAAKTRGLDPMFLPQEVEYSGSEKPGTVVIDTNQRFLFLVEEGGKARRYGVGVGKPGFEWAGRHQVSRKTEWPTWTPPEQMRQREAAKGRILPVSMKGGPENPLGARAMYLGSTLYRIHGTNQPWSIGKAVSSGCIRMRNEDVTDLYERVAVGTSVIVL